MRLAPRIGQFVTLGRARLCAYNGVNKDFPSQLEYTHNLDYDPRFSQYVPVISSLMLQPNSNKVSIYGYRLSDYADKIALIMIKNLQCLNPVVVVKNTHITCEVQDIGTVQAIANTNIV